MISWLTIEHPFSEPQNVLGCIMAHSFQTWWVMSEKEGPCTSTSHLTVFWGEIETIFRSTQTLLTLWHSESHLHGYCTNWYSKEMLHAAPWDSCLEGSLLGGPRTPWQTWEKACQKGRVMQNDHQLVKVFSSEIFFFLRLMICLIQLVFSQG